ncbi:MAG: hypothetical protein ACQGVK_03745 [Myxococcota bacterium]
MSPDSGRGRRRTPARRFGEADGPRVPTTPPAAPAAWSVLLLAVIAAFLLGASWSCGPLGAGGDECAGPDCPDRCPLYVVGSSDRGIDLVCEGDVPASCEQDRDCGEGERCVPAPCLLGPPCVEGEPCERPCPGVCAHDAPALCRDDLDCTEGERCDTEERCARPPGCGPDELCSHVCWGTCAPRDPEPGAGFCTSDTDCDEGLRCNAAEVCLPYPGCDVPGLACPAVCTGFCVEP